MSATYLKFSAPGHMVKKNARVTKDGLFKIILIDI